MSYFSSSSVGPTIVPMCVAVASWVLACPAWAAPNPLALMEKWEAAHRIAEEETEVVWVLQKEGGPERARQTHQLKVQDDKNGDRSLTRFMAPGDVKGVASLYHENLESEEDDQWLYLPAFKKLRRVGTSQLGDRFSDSDLYYQDLRRIVPKDYEYSLKGAETFEGQIAWVIEAKPKRADNPYGKVIFWLTKKDLNMVRNQLYDKNMRPLKEVAFKKWKKVTDTAWRADETHIVDVQRKHRTVLIVKKRKINPGFPASTFDSQRLGR